MCHLVLSRRHLLHHEQSQSHKTESKRSSEGSSYGSGDNGGNYGGSYNTNSYSKPAAEPAPAYTSGDTGDFEEIPMDDDLPF